MIHTIRLCTVFIHVNNISLVLSIGRNLSLGLGWAKVCFGFRLSFGLGLLFFGLANIGLYFNCAVA